MMRSALVAVVGFAVGCGGEAPDCSKVVPKAANAMHMDAAEVAVVARMCMKDWSAKQRQCVADATDSGAVVGCVPDLVKYEATQAGQAELAAKRAEASAARAVAEAAAAQATLAKLQADLEALNAKVSAAVDALASAQNDNDRAVAKAKLEELQKTKAELDAKVAAANAAAARAQRLKGVTISKECLDNPLAKGCQ